MATTSNTRRPGANNTASAPPKIDPATSIASVDLPTGTSDTAHIVAQSFGQPLHEADSRNASRHRDATRFVEQPPLPRYAADIFRNPPSPILSDGQTSVSRAVYCNGGQNSVSRPVYYNGGQDSASRAHYSNGGQSSVSRQVYSNGGQNSVHRAYDHPSNNGGQSSVQKRYVADRRASISNSDSDEHKGKDNGATVRSAHNVHKCKYCWRTIGHGHSGWCETFFISRGEAEV